MKAITSWPATNWRGPVAHLVDDARGLVAEPGREPQRGVLGEVAAPGRAVKGLHAGRPDPDPYLARPGHRIGHLDRVQDVRGAVAVEHDDGRHGLILYRCLTESIVWKISSDRRTREVLAWPR